MPIDNQYLQSLLALITAAWLFGAIILSAFQVVPVFRGRINSLWPILFSEALILFAASALFLLPSWLSFVVLCAVALRILFESYVIGRMANDRAHWTMHGRILVFPILPTLLFIFLMVQPRWQSTLLLVFLMVEIFDSFSLLGGKLFGRTKIVPSISPNKTFEGLITGVVAIFASAILTSLVLNLNYIQMFVVALMTIIGSICGDLLASVAKRRAGVKDYPAVIKIQGGLLDIYDSWIFAGPIVVCALWLTS